jgi:hypothetical protein
VTEVCEEGICENDVLLLGFSELEDRVWFG